MRWILFYLIILAASIYLAVSAYKKGGKPYFHWNFYAGILNGIGCIVIIVLIVIADMNKTDSKTVQKEKIQRYTIRVWYNSREDSSDVTILDKKTGTEEKFRIKGDKYEADSILLNSVL